MLPPGATVRPRDMDERGAVCRDLSVVAHRTEKCTGIDTRRGHSEMAEQ